MTHFRSCMRNTAAFGVLLAFSAAVRADEFRVGIERNSQTNLSQVSARYEPMTGYLRSAGVLRDLRLNVGAVDETQASLANQPPALLLVHRHAATQAQKTAGYTPIAHFETTKDDRLTLLATKESGIDTIKELGGKRVIVGKELGYSSGAIKQLLAAEGVSLTNVNFKYVRYTDMKLNMLQVAQGDAAVSVDKDAIATWKAGGGLATPIGGQPTKVLLAHASVGADGKAELARLFDPVSLSPGAKSALASAGLKAVSGKADAAVKIAQN